MPDPLFARPAGDVVRVALPLPVDSLFDYALPSAESGAPLEGEAPIGCRALVPFAGRRLTGVVVERVEAPDPDLALSAIDRLLDTRPAIGADLLAVLREAAEQVLCPLGIALATALPAGSAPRMIRQLVPTPRGRAALESGALDGQARELLRAIVARPTTPVALARRRPDAARSLALLEHDGLVARELRSAAPAARSSRLRVARVTGELDVDATCRDALARAPAQAALLQRLAESGEIPTSALAAPAALRALAERGYVRIEEREVTRNLLGAPVPRDEPAQLTREQRAALEPIAADVRALRHSSYLLHGVTGSGKTEVYLRAIAVALERSAQALVLVPEITLTHQIVARLRARFGDRLAVLHSGLRPSERVEQWERLRRGEVPIAVGARSALFAPLERLGVVVIDEEHDSAYKNEEGFRYHARDLARQIAQRAACPLILGSATPALETRHAAERGELERLVLSHRIGGRPLPAVELVDLEKERARSARGRKLILTRPLLRALRDTLAEGAQSILFLNRRGFSTQVFCFDCGHAERCKHCDVALVFHAGERLLRCHYCDYATSPPESCSGCGAPETALLGVGTQRVEEEVLSLLSDARVARLDRDTASRRGTTESVLNALRAGELDVLIGTQMVAKGHDFPGVRLVGVIAADLGLHMPDFRAAERTFQLLTQVAGRAGRDALPGRVIVQTFVPEHYAVAPVRTHDYEGFYRIELEHRQALGYPPFGRLAHAVVSDPDETRASEVCKRLAARARESAASLGGAVEVLGPAPAPLARLRGRYRFQLLVKGADAGEVLAVARALRGELGRIPRETQVALDANPVHML